MSYSELVADKSHHEYLTWVQSHGKGRGGRFEDLSRFLEAIDFQVSSSHSSDPKQTYPKSSEKRERK